MQVIARRTLKEFWARHPQAEGPIRAWFAIAAKAQWANPAEIKRQFGGTVDFVGDNRVIFDLGGNKYRLIVHISFAFGRVLVKFIGTHAEYDRIKWRPCHGEKNDPSNSYRNRIQRGSQRDRAVLRKRTETGHTGSGSLRSSRIDRRGLRAQALADRAPRDDGCAPLWQGTGRLYPSRSWPPFLQAEAGIRYPNQEASPHDENGLETA